MTDTANTAPDPTDRNTAIKMIRTALRRRSGKAWSVRGGTGTAWGWIEISSPPSRRNEHDNMTAAEAVELGTLLGLDRPAHHQGVSIAASGDHRREYVARAQGETPPVIDSPYWD